MKKLMVLIFIVFYLVSGMFGAGYISKHMKHGFGMLDSNMIRGQMLLKMKDELGLTPDQEKKIEQMSLNFQESVIKRMADTKVLELKLTNYLQGDKIDKKSIEKMVKEVAMMKADMQVDRIFHYLDIKGVLTPEQLKKVEELKKNFRKRAFFRDGKDRGDDRKGERRGARPSFR